MRIVFIGVVEFSAHCLKELYAIGANVVGVVTAQSSNANTDFVDLTPVALDHKTPVHYFEKSINNSATLDWIKDKAPDIIFCWGISQLVKTELLNLCPGGVIGVHPALLPKNRGRHPIIWSLVLGLSEGGLTFFRMDEGADSGPILSQQSFPIASDDTASVVYEKVKHSASEQIRKFIPALEDGTAKFIEQDHTQANTWRKRSAKDGMIDWRMPTRAIYNLVRALAPPYPGATFTHLEQLYTVHSVELYTAPFTPNIEPGRVLTTDNNSPVIQCADGAIILREITPPIVVNTGDYLG